MRFRTLLLLSMFVLVLAAPRAAAQQGSTQTLTTYPNGQTDTDDKPFRTSNYFTDFPGSWFVVWAPVTFETDVEIISIGMIVGHDGFNPDAPSPVQSGFRIVDDVEAAKDFVPEGENGPNYDGHEVFSLIQDNPMPEDFVPFGTSQGNDNYEFRSGSMSVPLTAGTYWFSYVWNDAFLVNGEYGPVMVEESLPAEELSAIQVWNSGFTEVGRAAISVTYRTGVDLSLDMNCDGLVNVDDVPAFVLALIDPAAYSATYPSCDINRADVNQDTLINGDDIAPFILAILEGSVIPPVQCNIGDANGDGTVNGLDVVPFVAAVLSPPQAGTAAFCQADVNLDLTVDFNDVAPFIDALLSGSAFPETFLFVSPGGDDDSPGTEAEPFRTIAKAADVVQPGGTILLRAGTYTETNIRFANSGQPGAPITIEGFPGEEVTLTTGSQAKWFFDFTDWFVTDMEGFGHYVFRNFKAHGSRHIWRLAFFGDGSRARPHHITIEDVVAWDCGSVLAARNGGVEYITIRRCDLSGCLGTEGSLDFSNNKDDLDTPQSGSHDILIEDCDFHDNNASQQINGIVTQGAVYNVTLRRCRSWNNGKYGFALKGSGNFVVDRCASWANGSSQFYLRGMIATDPPSRTVTAPNDLLLTNCIAIGPRDSGGAVVIWREGSNIRMYNCTIVSLRDVTLTNSGGPFANNERQTPPILPIRADVRNCIIVTHDGTAVRLFQGNGLPYIQNRAYEADHNVFFRLGGGSQTSFKYQGNNWPSIDSWKAYWAVGEPNGDDMLNGPIATQADANSQWADPLFVFVEQNALVPLAKTWLDDFVSVIDVTLQATSPAALSGENLTHLGIPQLMIDHYGVARPETGLWSIGAVHTPAP